MAKLKKLFLLIALALVIAGMLSMTVAAGGSDSTKNVFKIIAYICFALAAFLIVAAIVALVSVGGASVSAALWWTVGVLLALGLLFFMFASGGGDKDKLDDVQPDSQGDFSEAGEDTSDLRNSLSAQAAANQIMNIAKSIGIASLIAPTRCSDDKDSYIATFTKADAKEGYQYVVSYTINACTQPIAYTIKLKGDGAEKTLASSGVPQGNSYSDSISTIDSAVYTKVCISTAQQESCFDKSGNKI